MTIRKAKVAELVRLAKAHDMLVSIDGWRANAQSDAARAAYDTARKTATADEIALFERVYM